MDILTTVLTSLFSAAALFVLTKLLGHKQVSQLDFFDYVTGITIGSIAAELATELEHPWQPLTAMCVYALVSLFLAILTNKAPFTRKYVNGTPTILMDNGKIYRSNLKKAKLDLSEFLMLCREQGYFNLNDIQTAVFEYNGKLSVLPLSEKRPLNPIDIGICPQREFISTEVIMDGRILSENLKRMGLDEKWLAKQLELQGYFSEKNIFLGVCDSNHTLSVFEGM